MYDIIKNTLKTFMTQSKMADLFVGELSSSIHRYVGTLK